MSKTLTRRQHLGIVGKHVLYCRGRGTRTLAYRRKYKKEMCHLIEAANGVSTLFPR